MSQSTEIVTKQNSESKMDTEEGLFSAPLEVLPEYRDLSLPQMYYIVRKKLAILKNTPPNDPEDRKLLTRNCLEGLRLLSKQIEESGLFSDNEVIDDVSTECLKYINVAYDLGDLFMNSTLDPTRRGDFVKAGIVALKRFLDRCDLLMLLTEEQKREYDGKDPKQDPRTIRDIKIAKFKRERELETKIAALEDRINEFHKSRRKQRRQGGVRDTTIDNSENASEYAENGLEAVDDQEVHPDERELTLLQIDLNIDKALAHLSFAKQELELLNFGSLSMRPPMPSQAPSGARGPQYASGSMPASTPEPSGPPVIHRFKDPKDAATTPIPEHMKKFLQRIPRPEASAVASAAAYVAADGPATSPQECSKPGHVHNPMCWVGRQQRERLRREAESAHVAAVASGGCGHSHGADTSCGGEGMSGNPDAPWFKPSAMAHEHVKFDDLTQHTGFMMANVRGGRGTLVPVCPIHGNAHPAGQCPTLMQASGSNRDSGMATLLKDRVQEMMALRTDRSQVFRDTNPYLMDLDDWAVMKQAEGYLPSERDVRMAEQRRSEADFRSQRIEDGDESDEDQRKTQREIDDEEEQAQLEAREWDNWKDDNEKGAGNRNYRR